MPTDILIPKIGMTMVEATIATWLVGDGDSVQAGAPLLTIETEKSETDVEAPASGVVHHGAAAGETLPAGAVIGWIGGASAPPRPGGTTEAPAAVTKDEPAGRLLSSPNARRIARELGVELTLVTGTGPGGRITSEDVEAFVPPTARAVAVPHEASTTPATRPAATAATPAARFAAARLGLDLRDVEPADGTTVTRRDVETAATNGRRTVVAPVVPERAPAPAPSGRRRMTVMRRTIATRMKASLAEAAQLTLTTEVRMDAAVALRARLKEEWGAEGASVPTVTDLVLRATALALGDHPTMNARIDGDDIVEEPGVHLGVAVSLDAGLVVPVVRHADELPLADLAAAARTLAQAARAGTLGPDALSGGTFSVSNLGTEGVDAFTPILNPPNVGILGVGRLRDGVEWIEDGSPRRVQLLTLSLTWDHRALDGVPAARFAATVKRRLEAPTTLLR